MIGLYVVIAFFVCAFSAGSAAYIYTIMEWIYADGKKEAVLSALLVVMIVLAVAAGIFTLMGTIGWVICMIEMGLN